MDLWQLNQMKVIKRRIDDLTTILFCFIAYEVGGFVVLGVYLFFELSMRIYKNACNKKNELRLNSRADGSTYADSQGVKL